MCRVIEYLGQNHQLDMCNPGCTSQHQFFYVRLQPSHSNSVKPGCTKKRRLDLKVDLSHETHVESFEQMLQLSQAQLEVRPYIHYHIHRWSVVSLLCNRQAYSPCGSISKIRISLCWG